MRKVKSKELRKAAKEKVAAKIKAEKRPARKGEITAQYNKDKKEYLEARRSTGNPKLITTRRQQRNAIRPESENRIK